MVPGQSPLILRGFLLCIRDLLSQSSRSTFLTTLLPTLTPRDRLPIASALTHLVGCLLYDAND